MKKKKIVLLLAALAVLLGAAAVYRFVLAPQTAAGDKTLTVEVTHGDGSTASFTVQTEEEYLREALEQEGLIAGEESAYGLYVLTVDGETADEAKQQWWGYTKAGEYVAYSVDQCAIADGEQYEFTLNTGW